MARQIKGYSANSFVGSTIVAIKKREKDVYSKRQAKMVHITEYKGSFTDSTGRDFSLRVSRSSDAKFKETGIAYWIEVSEFNKNGGNR